MVEAKDSDAVGIHGESGNAKAIFYRYLWRSDMKRICCLCAVLAGCSVSPASRFDERIEELVAFPEEYRSWTHVKSVVILQGHVHYEAFGGIHHVYANDEALVALKEGKPFENGAALVFDLLEERTENNSIVEGPRKVIGVMEKDRERFPDTEGWGFEDFKEGDSHQRSVTDMRKQCLSCHETQSSSDYVYSRYRK